MMQVVAYHVAPSAETADRIAQSCATFHPENDYFALLAIVFRSAALFNADVQAVVLTDARTDLSQLGREVRVIRSQVDSERVMFSRLIAQIDYLEHEANHDNVAFVDSDMIINAPLGPLFADNFDLALTYRTDAAMPINGGVMLIKGGRAAAAASLLKRVGECYAAKFADQAHWWGDQHALIEVLGHKRFAERTSDRLEIDGVQVRLLPCERYNFSPENCSRAVRKSLDDKFILHFKGERKRLMPLYWNAHLAHRHQFGWQTLWQSYRARWGLRFAA